jgi:hypothetical protein
MGLVDVVEGVVAINGKTAPGALRWAEQAPHRISDVYATVSGYALRRISVRGKGKEIKGIEALLETLTLKGCIVTRWTRWGCQTEIEMKKEWRAFALGRRRQEGEGARVAGRLDEKRRREVCTRRESISALA